MLEKRKSKRSKMVLSVKVLVDKVTHLAHTVDITHKGARIGSLRTKLQVGTEVSLQRGSKRPNSEFLGFVSLDRMKFKLGSNQCSCWKTFGESIYPIRNEIGRGTHIPS